MQIHVFLRERVASQVYRRYLNKGKRERIVSFSLAPSLFHLFTSPRRSLSIFSVFREAGKRALVFSEPINILQIRYPREGKRFSSNSVELPPPSPPPFPNFDAPRLSPAGALGKNPPSRALLFATRLRETPRVS